MNGGMTNNKSDVFGQISDADRLLLFLDENVEAAFVWVCAAKIDSHGEFFAWGSRGDVVAGTAEREFSF